MKGFFMLKVLINGINGQMGTEVAKLVSSHKQMHLLGGLDKHIVHNLPYPVYDTLDDILEKPNVIIDFSVANATIGLLPFCLANQIPIVIATTGFTLEEQKQIDTASLKIPIFQSANMSYGITLMSKIVAALSTALKDSEIEIVETHHHFKKDAPSRHSPFAS